MPRTGPVDSLRNALPVKFLRDTPNPDAIDGKMLKSAVLYIHRTGTDYECKDCPWFQPGKGRCFLHSPSTEISPTGTCGYWVKGKPLPAIQDLQPTAALSKLESGYTEAPSGYSCKRCDEFLPDSQDCVKVDRNSPGDDPGLIHADACCCRWEPISKGEKSE